MNNIVPRLYALCGLFLGISCLAGAEQRPNVLFIIADDASRHFGQAYDCDWVKTPNIDRLASNGLVFDACYVVTSKCAPCRASLLTGRNSWQNEQAANHQSFFPSKLPTFSEKLKQAGYCTGKTGKVWGPGQATDAQGKPRDFGLPQVANGEKFSPGQSFARFLANNPADTPFLYWHGSSDPHRTYEAGSGQKAGKQSLEIDRVPAYWPDNDVVRSDMLDYALEVERFDTHVGEILAVLEDSGLAENTLVIVTSDHGMPFPRVKGHTFDDTHRVPTVMCWPEGIKNPGRRIDALVSFIDFAPTLLELAGLDPKECGMDLTGHSITDLFAEAPKHDRPFLLIGRERNDVYARPGTPAGLGYPARGIRAGDFLYVRNFAPDRWPCGNPELGLRDTDDSPTKAVINELGPGNPHWEHAFGMRPAEMLFNVRDDPDCVHNLVEDPTHAATRDRLSATMMAELKQQRDPRILGRGDVFENYPTVKPRPSDWQEDSIPKSQ